MPTAEGFEVDKLSKAHVTSYIHEYLDPVAEALGPLYGTTFKALLIDSWEAGMLNWTDAMLDEFKTRRGYDPTPWLPVLTGRVVESADASDRFLWDYRRTLSDLIADNHYGAIANFLHERGLLLTSEAAGLGTPTLEDGLLNKGKTDIPMAEFWMQGFPDGRTLRDTDEADVREAASAAHIYGTNIAAAESFTTIGVSAWEHTPAYLKWAADYTMTLGLNRFVIHTSAHQPFERKPGMTLDVAGQHFSRHTTWAELAGPWMTYLARSSYLLQQGRFVADLCYYYGESTPVTVPATKEISPAPPAGYSYDFLNTEVLLNRLKVVDGRLVLPGGMSYRVLVLPETDRMTPRVAEKIRELASAGAVVVGPKPSRSPSLSGQPAADEKVAAVAAEVWGDLDGTTRTRRSFGKGRVIWGESLEQVLSGESVAPDVTFAGPGEDDTPVWIHRRAGDTEIYFVANITEEKKTVRADFRVSGKAPEFWHPDTGTMAPAEYTIAAGRTEVPLELEPSGSVFVVFREKAAAPSRKLPKPVESRLGAIEGAWDVQFPSGWGAPEQIHLDKLISWTEHPEAGVRYFSGTAAYTREIEAPAEWFLPKARVFLDLGEVEEFAEVSVNGRPLGILWKPPYRVDVTEVLQQGNNSLEIKVTNPWLNRLIGDLDLPKSERYTFTSALESSHTSEAEYKASPLSPSGLLGPVTVRSITGD